MTDIGGGYTIEPVTKKNIDELRKIRIYKEQRGFIADIDISLMQASFLPKWQGRILRHNAAIVGFGSFSEKCPRAKINKIMIDRNNQGKGHGNKLLETILNEIRDMGYSEVTLNSNTCNHAAISLYKKYGFVEIDKCNTDIIMRKEFHAA
jgi:ribosomal protein S18 acetylase RimI-like enzyme